jgi:hypothetical protein
MTNLGLKYGLSASRFMSSQPDSLTQGDEVRHRLLTFGNGLKPVDDENFYFFFEIVRELIDAALNNYDRLRKAYVDTDHNALAWASRNLLELAIFLKYVLSSGANARRFGDDRLVDGYELFSALRDLERHLDPSSGTEALDGIVALYQQQMLDENVTATKHLMVGKLADQVGLTAEFTTMNRVSSKLVHPTAWSVLAMNPGLISFPGARDILFLSGIGYMAQLLVAAKTHNTRQGMRPNL